MITDYIKAALRRAKYEMAEEEGFFATIPDLQGVWANAPTLEACREELEEVLQDWILLSLHMHTPLPVVDGIDLNAKPGEIEDVA